MFCQKCGAESLDTTKFCVKCGHRLKIEPRISNKAMLIAGIAAAVSISVALLGFLPQSEQTKAQSETQPTTVVISPSPRASPTTRPTQKPKPTPEPTPESKRRPEKPRPTLTWEPRTTSLPQIRLMAPNDGSVFSHIPRRLTLVWSPIQEANLYGVAIEYDNNGKWELLYGTYTYMLNLTMTFSSPLSARWRVTPIFDHGRTGDPSEWRTFQFTR